MVQGVTNMYISIKIFIFKVPGVQCISAVYEVTFLTFWHAFFQSVAQSVSSIIRSFSFPFYSLSVSVTFTSLIFQYVDALLFYATCMTCKRYVKMHFYFSYDGGHSLDEGSRPKFLDTIRFVEHYLNDLVNNSWLFSNKQQNKLTHQVQ